MLDLERINICGKAKCYNKGWSLCNVVYNALYKATKSNGICSRRRSDPYASNEVSNISTT